MEMLDVTSALTTNAMPAYRQQSITSNSLLATSNQQPATKQREARAESTAKDFEAMFLSQMMEPMFDSVEKDELTGGGEGEDVFKSMLTNEYGKIITASGGIGLASVIKAQLLKTQEVP